MSMFEKLITAGVFCAAFVCVTVVRLKKLSIIREVALVNAEHGKDFNLNL